MTKAFNVIELAEFFERYAERNQHDEVRFVKDEADAIAAALRAYALPEGGLTVEELLKCMHEIGNSVAMDIEYALKLYEEERRQPQLGSDK